MKNFYTKFSRPVASFRKNEKSREVFISRDKKRGHKPKSLWSFLGEIFKGFPLLAVSETNIVILVEGWLFVNGRSLLP